MPCCTAAAQKNHKLQTGYYTAARLGANYFAAKLAPLARLFRNKLVLCGTENALVFRDNLHFLLRKPKKGC